MAKNTKSPNRTFARIAVADQNAVESSLLKIFLNATGADVSEHQTGHDTVAAVTKATTDDASIDIVVLNMELQDIDGIKTAQMLRQVGFAGPIIGTSPILTENIKANWKAAGCNQFLQKPISGKTITEVITRLKDESGVPQSLE